MHLFFLQMSACCHCGLFLGDTGNFFQGHVHFGGFVGHQRFGVGRLWGGGRAGEGLPRHGGGGSDGLLDGSLPLLHGSQVGDVDEFGAAIGDNRHGYGDGGGGI